MREAGGRPSAGMCPRAWDADGDPIAEAIIVLLARADSAAIARLLEFQFKRTQDPLDRYEKAVTSFSAEYYQHPADFTGVVTASFAEGATTLRRLVDAQQCVLDFQEANRAYRVPCDVERLAPDDALFKATYWHNALFNPNLPPDIAVLAFVPDWLHASRSHNG